MSARFDVFQVRFDGGVRWLGAFDTIEQARACVTQSRDENPEIRHIINDNGTGARHDFPEEQEPHALPSRRRQSS
jgi:hypothetical protein